MVLSEACCLITDRISVDDLSLEQYISTENILPDKGGITMASSKPESGSVIKFEIGDILISNIRPYFKKIWKATFNGGCSPDVMCFRSRNPEICDYIYYNLSQQEFFDFVMAGANGAKMPRGSKTHTLKWEIKDLPNKEKIATILSSLDDKIETNRAINARLEELASAIFKSWFIDFEPFAEGEFVEDEDGRRPKELIYKRIGDYNCTIETGRRPKGGVNGILNGVPSIGAESIKGIGYYDYSKTKFITHEFASSLKRGKIKDYDLLLYKDGGKPGYFIPDFSMMGEGFPFEEMYLNEHVFRLDFGSPYLNIFAYFFMRTDYVMNYLNSVGGKAAIPGINQKNVEDIRIFDLDIEYVTKFGELVYPMFKKILQNSKENARLASLRDTLLPRLMSGELIPE